MIIIRRLRQIIVSFCRRSNSFIELRQSSVTIYHIVDEFITIIENDFLIDSWKFHFTIDNYNVHHCLINNKTSLYLWNFAKRLNVCERRKIGYIFFYCNFKFAHQREHLERRERDCNLLTTLSLWNENNTVWFKLLRGTTAAINGVHVHHWQLKFMCFPGKNFSHFLHSARLLQVVYDAIRCAALPSNCNNVEKNEEKRLQLKLMNNSKFYGILRVSLCISYSNFLLEDAEKM